MCICENRGIVCEDGEIKIQMRKVMINNIPKHGKRKKQFKPVKKAMQINLE